jgi:hypothetical protein
MSGKCGKCERVVNEAKLEHMNLFDGRMRIAAFSASCPHCGTTMGVVVDPRPMDDNLLSIKKAVGGR